MSEILTGRSFLDKNPPFAAGVINPGNKGFAREKPSVCSRGQKPGQEWVCYRENLPYAAGIRNSGRTGFAREKPSIRSSCQNPGRKGFAR